MTNRIFNTIAILFLATKMLFGQDPQFTQFFSAPMYLAPSFAGATQQHRIATTYRTQWLGVGGGGFNTYVLGYDHYFANFNSGVGVYVLRDMAGSGQLSNNIYSLQYSYDIQFFDTWHCRPGLGFQYSTYSVDFNKLIFRDQITRSTIDPNGYIISASSIEKGPASNLKGDIDAGTSALFYADRIWFGGCVDHLLQPKRSFYDENIYVPMKYSFFGGAQIIKRGRLLKPIDESISVAFLYKAQKEYKQLDVGIYWFKIPLVLGFWYRGIPLVNSPRGDALAFLLGYKMPHISIGYSYDFTISQLINSTAGSHELSIIYEFTGRMKKKVRALPCPDF